MKKIAEYRVKPLWTLSCFNRKPVKEFMFLAARIFGKLIPNWVRKEVLPRQWWFGGEEIGLSNSKCPIAGMMIESIESPPVGEAHLVEGLIVGFRAMKLKQSDVPSPYLPGADWKKLLDSQWRQISNNLENTNLIASFLRNFFRNEGLSGFWGFDRMFQLFSILDGCSSIGRARVMQEQYLVWREALPNASVRELDAPKIGNPWGYLIEGALLYEPVLEYNYQANYFKKLLCEMSSPIIIEIGGGFGGLAFQIIRLIPNVRYIGFDLPENIFLQSYYLKCAFPELNILTYHEGMSILTKEEIAKYDIILLPNFMIPNVESNVADLVVNIRSLSEMPQETIEEYISQVDRLGRNYFFHENLFKRRLDGFHGIPSNDFPLLKNYVLLAESESRWPRYFKNSGYPCHEYLYINRARIGH